MSRITQSLLALQRRLFTKVDGAWLAALRILFGGIVCGSTLRVLLLGAMSSSVYANWVEAFFINSPFHFKYWGFSWVEPPPGDGIYVLLFAICALSLAVAAGFCFRLTAPALAICWIYFELIDATFYVNHYYLLSLLSVLLAVSPAHKLWSVDAWIARRTRAAHRPASDSSVSAAWLYLFRFQIAVVYTFAGLAKAQTDWLVHAQPLRIWLAAKTDLPLLGPLLLQPWAAPVMSWAGFLFDTAIPWLLLIPRVRPLAYCALIVFHVLTYVLFPRITMFPVIMILTALVFFPPDWPRSLGRFLRIGHNPAARGNPVAHGASEAGARGGEAATPVEATATGRQHAALALGAIYCLVQILVPLRFLLYGGDVRWHEQGLRFSWRVLHREKLGVVSFTARNKRSGRVFEVDPSYYLNPVQATEMAEQPDLILQLAHHIRDDFARRGLGPVEVRARALSTLNGRPSALLVDPEVDLGAVQDSLAPAPWILPVPSTPPPHNRAPR